MGRYVWPGAAKAMLEISRRSCFSKTFERLAERCGLDGVSFHCLRHTYATVKSWVRCSMPER